MLSLNRLHRVFTHDGIVAALSQDAQQHTDKQLSWVGDEAWRELAIEAIELRALCGQEQIRVLAGDHSLLIAAQGDEVVGLVFVKGHPVVKSVVRMVRQLLRHAVKADQAKPDNSEASALRPAAPSPKPTPSPTVDPVGTPSAATANDPSDPRKLRF